MKFSAEIDGKWKISFNEGVSEDDCPEKTLSGFRNASKIDFYETDSGHEFLAQVGVEGDNYSIKGGAKLGYSAEGDNLLWRIWNFETISTTFAEGNAEVQGWRESITIAGAEYKCVCASDSIELSFNVQIRPRWSRIGAVAGTVAAVATAPTWAPAASSVLVPASTVWVLAELAS